MRQLARMSSAFLTSFFLFPCQQRLFSVPNRKKPAVRSTIHRQSRVVLLFVKSLTGISMMSLEQALHVYYMTFVTREFRVSIEPIWRTMSLAFQVPSVWFEQIREHATRVTEGPSSSKNGSHFTFGCRPQGSLSSNGHLGIIVQGCILRHAPMRNS